LASVKGVKFINQLNNFKLLTKHFATFRLIGQYVRQLVSLPVLAEKSEG